MNGLRKTNFINGLLTLNDIYKLGIKREDLEDLSTTQLRQKSFDIRKKLGLHIRKNSILLEKERHDN